jgi:N-acetylglucosamine kinase-like BadF-type ATPase
MLHLGIDIGGTKMEAVLLDPAGECVPIPRVNGCGLTARISAIRVSS